MELVALRKQVAELQQRNEALQSRLRVANDEISRLRGKDAATIDSTSGTGTRRDAADVDAAAWVSSQLQLHDREQASQQLLLTICELLQVPEPTDIIPALSTVVRAVKRLPQMDSFIGEVAAIVLEASSRADLRSRSLHDIVPILHRWKAERADGRIEDLRAFRASIAQALMLAQPPVECDHDEVGDAHMKRLARPRDLADNYRLMVSQVVQLVQDRTESQRQLLSRQGVYRQAEALMDPQSLPTQMIRHFQRCADFCMPY